MHPDAEMQTDRRSDGCGNEEGRLRVRGVHEHEKNGYTLRGKNGAKELPKDKARSREFGKYRRPRSEKYSQDNNLGDD